MSAPTAASMPTAAGIAMGRWVIETKRFLRQRESVVFTIGLPVLLLVIFGSVFNKDIAPGVTYSQYFAAGMIASGLVNSGFQALAIGVGIERDNGGLKRLSGSPMPKPSYFAGKFLLVATISALQIALLMIIGIAAFGLDVPSAKGWITLAWLWALGGFTCALLGIAFSSVPRDAESAPAIVTPIVLVLQFISGVFFQYDQLPSWMQHVAAIFPLKWLTQGMRSVFLPSSFQSQEVSGSWQLPLVFLVLVIWGVIGAVLCVRTFRWQRRGED
ncbi:MAG TPA: ABC transporter permease [Actinomycetes bacterium]|nr:ABC transporter permease [Actinomycetes bacterium]